MNVDLPSVGARLWVRISQPPAATNTTTKKWVLLLHGWPDTGELWAPQTAALTQAGYSVIAPDLPGFGQSAFTTNDSPLDPRHYTLRNVVTVLTALLDQLGVGRLHVLVGHDWGAALAWTFAASHPSRLERLVVLSVGHPGGGAAADPRQRAKWWYQLFFCLPGAEAAVAANDWALFRQIMGPSCSEGQLQAYIQQLQQPGALTSSLNYYRANTHARHFGATQPLTPNRLQLLRLPVLGVWSAGDTALLEPQMLASRAYVAPGCWRYRRIDEGDGGVGGRVGHWIPRDAPEQLNRLLLQFLSDELDETGGGGSSSSSTMVSKL